MKPYYEHAGITIYHGDCREILPQLPKGWCSTCACVLTDEQIVAIHLAAKHAVGPLCEVLLTDPPYGIGWSRGVNNQRASKSHDGIAGDEDTSVRDAALELLRAIPAIVFGSFYAQFPRGLKQVMVWQKPADAGVVGSVTGYRRDAEPIFLVGDWPISTVRWSSVLRSIGGIAAVTTETGHPHTKPLPLIQTLLERSDGTSVIDPFFGSGTTLLAAKNLHRRAIGIEIHEPYCEIAAKRLSQEVLNFAECREEEI